MRCLPDNESSCCQHCAQQRNPWHCLAASPCTLPACGSVLATPLWCWLLPVLLLLLLGLLGRDCRVTLLLLSLCCWVLSEACREHGYAVNLHASTTSDLLQVLNDPKEVLEDKLGFHVHRWKTVLL